MRWAAVLREFGRCEVQSKSIGPGLKIHKSFEVAIVDMPLLCREAILMVVDRHLSIERLCNVCTLAGDEEDLLVDLGNSQYAV